MQNESQKTNLFFTLWYQLKNLMYFQEIGCLMQKITMAVFLTKLRAIAGINKLRNYYNRDKI